MCGLGVYAHLPLTAYEQYSIFQRSLEEYSMPRFFCQPPRMLRGKFCTDWLIWGRAAD